MHLQGLTQLLRESTVYTEVIDHLRQNQTPLSINLIRSARPYLLATLARDWDGAIIYVTSRIKNAYNISEQLPVWLDTDRPVLRFPEPMTQFYERVTWGDSVIRERMEALSALLPPDDDLVEQHPIVVTSARALMQRTMPVNQFRQNIMAMRIGDRFTLDKLLNKWVGMGYEPVPIVVEQGTFSRRGGVVDIFPVASELPVRIEFFDDEVDSMRLFDVSTQRSEKTISSTVITPTREALPQQTAQIATHLRDWFEALQPPEEDMTSPSGDYESLAHGVAFPYLEFYLPYMYAHPVSLLDYATDNTLIVIEDMDELAETVADLEERALQIRDDQHAQGQLPPNYPQPYLDWGQFNESLQERTSLHLSNASAELNELENALSAVFTPVQRFGGQLRPLLRHVRDLSNGDARAIVVTQQTTRLRDLWYEQDSEYVPINTTIEDKPVEGALLFVGGALTEGWSLTVKENSRISETHLITDAEIFGWSRSEPRRRKSGKRSRPPEANYADWKENDYVVHVDYGVGQFLGLRNRTIEGNEREYLVVQYGGNDMIFVPIHQADRLTKYIGADDSPPKVSRLGQPEWKRIKKRAKKAIEEEAKELLELYAARAQAKGTIYSKDTPWQHELEASFPYVETDDQLQAVREVKVDMEAGLPMDRLICGDVGYGKTEVALRAAFKAVMDGKQVAVLVPTTVLAHQHYETFSRRLEPFPVKIEVLSRFRDKSYQSRILPKIATGEVDIIIGTHRLLSKDITMHDLGLVIIDEEQRFGVKQKEHFKQLRNQVDILTLTATPIPRTLYMGLTGVRDISMIQTPPEERLPVITHVGKFDSKLVRQAILREMERGGQVFIVHNRVKTIETLRDKIQGIVPDARIVVGHGQMTGKYLEDVMSRFGRGEFDILLSTSIIESGIDIPNVNTMIIDRADWFGMAQLYQLRGRVGRSAQQAYAYFFHAGTKRLTEEAKARLDTLAENTNLGAGFQIAMRDLEIRGAGDILSTRQTGQVSAIGLNLYTQLLTQTVNRLKGQQEGDSEQSNVEAQGVVIDLPIPAYLPSDWIPEMALRLQIYRRIAGLTKAQDVEAMRNEIRDRFGQLPLAVEGLLYQMEVKLWAQSAKATHVMGRDEQLQIKLPYLAEVNRPSLAQALGDDVQVSRTAITLPLSDELWQARLLDILRELAEGKQEGVGI